MRINNLLLFTFFVFAPIFAACERDGRQERNSGFDMPELTESNTVAFTATVKAGDYVYIMLDGGKIAVDWGDGKVTKDIEPGKGDLWRTEFTHVYKTAGDYRIRVLSDEVTLIHMSSLLHSYKKLHVGDCPALRNAMFNSLPEVVSLVLSGCPNLEMLNVGNCEKLETIDIGDCPALQMFTAYTNPNLKALDLSSNDKLYSAECFDCGVEEIQLPDGIVMVDLANNNLKSISLTDNDNLVSLNCTGNKDLATITLTGCDNLNALYFSDTQIGSFDFSDFPELSRISCSNTKMSELDVSKNAKLSILECKGLGLTSLDIGNNLSLTDLDCGDNSLSALDVSKNTKFRNLFINGNELNKDNLEAVFAALPRFDPATATNVRSYIIPTPVPSKIKIYENPGAEKCNTKIITDKGWVILTNPN